MYLTSEGVELRGGSGPHEGNIWVDGKPVCDDFFTSSSGRDYGHGNALIVCRFSR